MNLDFNLDKIILEFPGKNGVSNLKIKHTIESIFITGGVGSGKSTGSGALLARKYLENQFGGIVLTVKADEVEAWKDYARITSREKDLIIVEPGSKHYFNFLEYESHNLVNGISLIDNILQVLKTVIRANEEKSGGRSDDPFWEVSTDMVIYNVLSLCHLAYGKISIQKVYDIALSVPKKDVEISDPPKKNTYEYAFLEAQKKVNALVDEFVKKLTPEQSKIADDPECFEQLILDHIPEANTLKSVDQFFIESFRNISEKTRAIIEFCFSGFLFNLLKEPVYSLFCKHESTYTPEDCLNGKIIILNLPVKRYHKVGRDIQIMFKYIFQRAMERRDVKANNRVVFIWADEAQHFIHEHDAEYLATSRSSRIATVYLTQNLPNIYANMGGLKSEHKVKSLLGTMATKIFHANADHETNVYAANLIGEGYIEDNSSSKTISGKFSSTESQSFKLEKIVRPEQFVSLKTGGAENNFLVQAYIHRQGTPFSDGLNFKKIAFKQHL